MEQQGNRLHPNVLLGSVACLLLTLAVDVRAANAQPATAQPATAAAARQPVAMVLEVRGPVTLQTGGSTRTIKHGDMVRPTDQIQTAEGNQLKLIFFGDLHREVIKAPVAVKERGCDPATAVQREDPPHPVVATRQPKGSPLATDVPENTKQNLHWLNSSLHRDGAAAAGVLRGGDFKPGPVIAPSYETTVLSDRPHFAWPDQGKDAHYTISVTSSGSDRNAWTAKQETKIPKLGYPADQAPLKRGQRYDWTVEGLKADGTPIELYGAFRVASAELAQDLAPLTALAAGNNAEQLLLAAAALEEHGISDDALTIYRRLSQTFPDEPALLLACVRGYERAGDQQSLRQALVDCAAAYRRQGNTAAAAPLLEQARDLGWREKSNADE